MANELVSFADQERIKFATVNSGSYSGVGKNADSNHIDGAQRFTNLQIDQGDTVVEAYLVLPYSSVGSSGGDWKFQVNAIDEDNTSSFNSSVFSRSKTTAQVDIDDGAPTSGGEKSINVTPLVQEVVNRTGFSNGDNIGFIYENTNSDTDTLAYFDLDTSYLWYRVEAEPNFKPTPKSVSAPSVPSMDTAGLFISEPDVSVFDATADQMYQDTTKVQGKIFAEGAHTSTSVGTTTLPHDLGYLPEHQVYALGTDPSDDWVKLPIYNSYASDMHYYIDDDNLYLYSSVVGQKFYYRIFLDSIE